MSKSPADCEHMVGQYQYLDEHGDADGWEPIHAEYDFSKTQDFVERLELEETYNLAIIEKFTFCPYCGSTIKWNE